MAAMSDPLRNFNFSRRWVGPPDWKRERPAIAGTINRAEFKDGSSIHQTNASARLSQWASRLDRIADYELAHGHNDAAERLSRQAAELREAM